MLETPAHPLVDILSKQTRYIHFSLPDAQTLIFDATGCDLVALELNGDRTLTAIQEGQAVHLRPIERRE